MKKAVKLVLKEETTFDLYFDDGKVKRYDILLLGDKFPQLLQLKDRNLFLKGHLFGTSGVIWNDELDIDALTVYQEGKDVSNEYDDIENVNLGFQIKEKRLEKFMSQEELAKLINIDQSDLSKIEKGMGNPSLKTISRIAKGLNSNFSVRIK